MRRKVVVLLMLITTLGSMTSCYWQKYQEDKPTITVTLFPQYDIVHHLASEYVNIHYILAPGIGAHEYEPTTKQVLTMLNSDILFYSSSLLEPWVSAFISSEPKAPVTIVDLSASVTLIDSHHGEDHHQEETFDPHYWLDPINAISMVQTILDYLIVLLPNQSAILQQNASDYIDELMQIDQGFIDLMQYAQSNQILYGGHYAFGYVSNRYGMDYMTPFVGYSSEEEPTAAALASMVKTMQTMGNIVIYAEHLDGQEIAKTIVEGYSTASIVTLYACENITKSQKQQGATFLSLLQSNIEALKIGLQYQR